MKPTPTILTLILTALLTITFTLATPPDPIHYYNATYNNTLDPLEDSVNHMNLSGVGGISQTTGFRAEGIQINAGFLYKDSSQIQWTDQKTICMWVNPSTFNVSGQAHRFMQFGNITDGDDKYEWFYSGDLIGIYDNINPANIMQEHVLIPNNTWTHACLAINFNTGEGSMYINNILLNTTTQFIPVPHDPTIPTTYLMFGTMDGGVQPVLMDEISIFNTTLTAQDVTDLYYNGTGTFFEGGAWTGFAPPVPLTLQDGVYHYYPLNDTDTSMNTLKDWINGNDATNQGAAQTTAQGIITQAINLSGMDSTPQYTTTTALSWISTGDFTYSFFAKMTAPSDVRADITVDETTPAALFITYGSEVNSAWEFKISGDSELTWDAAQYSNASLATDSQWHYYVFERNATHLSIWVDAVLVNTTVSTGVDLSSLANGALFGYDNGDDDLIVDELTIWNRSLTAAEIAQAYLNQTDGCIVAFNECPAAPPIPQAPVIQAVGWNTTTGNQNMTLFLNSTLDWIFANVTDADNLSSEVTVKVHVSTPNSLVIENNTTMPNTYASMYELNTNILLNETGVWVFLFTADDAQAYETNVSVLNVTCTPNYACNGYASCLTNDTQYCNSVTDLNFCGASYGGDYSEFSPQACNYCTGAYSSPILGTCTAGNQTIGYVYTNTCCAQTSLPSDCTAPANSTQACGGYTPNYSSTDLGASIIDVLVTIILVLGSFAAVIAIVLGIRWVRK